jgi:tetratricopeptide (TPR) repeat protein
MRELYLLFLLMLPLGLAAQVVNATHDKLEVKYAVGDYEWVYKKAEGLMDDDKFKKDPEPFLWAALCQLQFHRTGDEKLKAKYPKGLAEALKLTAKAASKDKDGSFMPDQREFIDELKEEAVAVVIEHLAAKDYRKANGILKQVLAFDPGDDYIRLSKGYTDLRTGNTAEGERLAAEALPRLDSSYRDLAYRPNPISSPLLREALVSYIIHLRDSGQRQLAREASLSGRIIFPLDEEVKGLAEELR